MKNITIILGILTLLVLVGCKAETTGMTVNTANAPMQITKDNLVQGIVLEPTLTYVKFTPTVGEIKFNKLTYTEKLSYVGSVENLFTRYANPEGKFSHRIGNSYRGLEWRDLNNLKIKPNKVYEIYIDENEDQTLSISE